MAPPEKPHVDKQDLQKKKVAPVGGMFVGKPWSSSSCAEAEQPPKKSQALKDKERHHYLSSDDAKALEDALEQDCPKIAKKNESLRAKSQLQICIPQGQKHQRARKTKKAPRI